MLVVCVMFLKLNAGKAVALAEMKDQSSTCVNEHKCRRCVWVWRILPAKQGDAHQNRASLYSKILLPNKTCQIGINAGGNRAGQS